MKRFKKYSRSLYLQVITAVIAGAVADADAVIIAGTLGSVCSCSSPIQQRGTRLDITSDRDPDTGFEGLHRCGGQRHRFDQVVDRLGRTLEGHQRASATRAGGQGRCAGRARSCRRYRPEIPTHRRS